MFWNADNESRSPMGSMLGSLTGASGLTDTQMRSAATYSTWDATVWNITDGLYPTLRNAPLP